MKIKTKKGYSLIETSAGILLILMASIIIITGTKIALSGYAEGRKVHAINERLMTSAETGIAKDDINSTNAPKTLSVGSYSFKGELKTYTDVSGLSYMVFDLEKKN